MQERERERERENCFSNLLLFDFIEEVEVFGRSRARESLFAFLTCKRKLGLLSS
jgi:hypothetical protein